MFAAPSVVGVCVSDLEESEAFGAHQPHGEVLQGAVARLLAREQRAILRRKDAEVVAVELEVERTPAGVGPHSLRTERLYALAQLRELGRPDGALQRLVMLEIEVQLSQKVRLVARLDAGETVRPQNVSAQTGLDS